MNKILIVLIILIPINLHAWGLFGDKVKEDEIVVVEEIKEEPKVYHKSLFVFEYPDGGKVYFIYRLIENDIIQVGIVDENKMLIKTVEKLKITGEYKYFGETKKKEYIESNFPNTTTLEFYESK